MEAVLADRTGSWGVALTREGAKRSFLWSVKNWELSGQFSQKNATYTTTYSDRSPLCIQSTWATDSRSSNKVPQHHRIIWTDLPIEGDPIRLVCSWSMSQHWVRGSELLMVVGKDWSIQPTRRSLTISCINGLSKVNLLWIVCTPLWTTFKATKLSIQKVQLTKLDKLEYYVTLTSSLLSTVSAALLFRHHKTNHYWWTRFKLQRIFLDQNLSIKS